MTFKIQIELWVGLCINFTSELVIQALTQNPKSKIRFWILFFRNPKSNFGFQGDHAFKKCCCILILDLSGLPEANKKDPTRIGVAGNHYQGCST